MWMLLKGLASIPRRFADGNDTTVESSAVGLAVALVSLIGFQAWALYRGQTFDAGQYGMALGVALGGGAAGAAGTRFLRHGFRTPTEPIPGANVRPDNPDGG